jgi:hypothetical protein
MEMVVKNRKMIAESQLELGKSLFGRGSRFKGIEE